MKWYFYLNYFIYRHYKKKEYIPVVTALLGTCLLVYLNIFTIWVIYKFITDFWTIPQPLSDYKIIIITGMAFICLINYLLLYNRKKYVKVFEEFKKNNDKYKNWDISARLYIILSISICLIVLIIADLRNHNFELYFLK